MASFHVHLFRPSLSLAYPIDSAVPTRRRVWWNSPNRAMRWHAYYPEQADQDPIYRSALPVLGVDATAVTT